MSKYSLTDEQKKAISARMKGKRNASGVHKPRSDAKLANLLDAWLRKTRWVCKLLVDKDRYHRGNYLRIKHLSDKMRRIAKELYKDVRAPADCDITPFLDEIFDKCQDPDKREYYERFIRQHPTNIADALLRNENLLVRKRTEWDWIKDVEAIADKPWTTAEEIAEIEHGDK